MRLGGDPLSQDPEMTVSDPQDNFFVISGSLLSYLGILT